MKKKFLKLPIHHKIFFLTLALAVLSAGTFAGIFYAKKAFTSPAPSAQSRLRMPSDPSRMRGETSGIGTHFAVTNSEYLNIALDSTETVDLKLTSIPKVITMMFAQATTTPSARGGQATQITLSGLLKNTTYYKYEDDYHHLAEFTTDDNGTYAYTQDLSTRHFVFIQTVKSTKFIADNETGGDCSTIGNWNAETKTCTLTTDLTETVQIDSDGVTLDGNGHKITITPEYSAVGLYIYYRTGVIAKNLTVNGAYFGIFLGQSSGSTITNDVLTGNSFGVNVRFDSNNNTIVNNIANGNSDTGIVFYNSYNNTASNNIASNNGNYGISIINNSFGNQILDNTMEENAVNDLDMAIMNTSYPIMCNNTIIGNIGSGGLPIKFFNSSATLDGGVFSELILCDADNSDMRNIQIKGSGLFAYQTDNSKFSNITSSGNLTDIILNTSEFNTLKNIYVTSIHSGYGIFFISSNGNEIDESVINNKWNGITGYWSDSNVIHNTSISNNVLGIEWWKSSGNLIYNNNFINNTYRQISDRALVNNYNLAKPTGGNYWSDYDVPEEGCDDANNDGFCDAPYLSIGGAQDNLPWTRQDGWKGKTVKVAVVLAEMSDTFHSAGSFTKQFCDANGDRVTKTYAGHTREYFQDLTNCVRDYYKENSYGAVNVEFDIFDNNGSWYRTNGLYSDYISLTNPLKSIKQFVRDAYFVPKPLIEGKYDAVAVVHAGYSAIHPDDNGYLLQSQTWNPNDQPITNPPYSLIVGEFENMGTLTHELGHVLGAIFTPEHTSTPDMYKLPWNKMGDIGAWDLMSLGAIGSFKDNPTHMSSYIKEFLGWLKYDSHFDGSYGTSPIDALETKTAGSGVFRYNTDLSKNTYYIAEARDKNLARWDTLLPDNKEKALVLYYVDTRGSDTYGYNWTGNPKYLSRTISIPQGGVLTPNGESYADHDNLLRFTKIGDNEDLTSIPKTYSVDLNVSRIEPIQFPFPLYGMVFRTASTSPLSERLKGLFFGSMIPLDGPVAYQDPGIGISFVGESFGFEGRSLPALSYIVFICSLIIALIFFIAFCFIRDKQRRKQLRCRFIFTFIGVEILMTLFWWYRLYVRVIYPLYVPMEESSSVTPDLDLHAITPNGRHIGMNYTTGRYENQIANSIVSSDLDNMHEWIFVPSTETVRYYVSSHDTQAFFEANPDIASQVPDKTDKYELYARTIDPATGIFTSATTSQSIQPGVADFYQITGTVTPSVIQTDKNAKDLISLFRSFVSSPSMPKTLRQILLSETNIVEKLLAKNLKKPALALVQSEKRMTELFTCGTKKTDLFAGMQTEKNAVNILAKEGVNATDITGMNGIFNQFGRSQKCGLAKSDADILLGILGKLEGVIRK